MHSEIAREGQSFGLLAFFHARRNDAAICSGNRFLQRAGDGGKRGLRDFCYHSLAHYGELEKENGNNADNNEGYLFDPDEYIGGYDIYA